MARRIRIRQIKSAGGHPSDQGRTIRALGIRKLNQVVEHNDTPQIRGMVTKVRHLVEVSEAGQES